MNTEEQAHRYKVAVDGLKDVEIDGVSEVEVPAGMLQSFMTVVRAQPDSGNKGANPIHFEITALEDQKIHVREKASFMLP